MRAIIALLLALPLAAADTVIQNATVLTITKGTFHGSIVIRDGKIVDAGEKVMVPPGAKIIDAAGQYVMPALSIATRTSARTASTRAPSRCLPWWGSTTC